MGAGNKFGVTNEIRDILLGVPGIEALVGDRVFPVVAPKNTRGDFIVYRRSSHYVERRGGYFIGRTKMGIASQICKVFVNVVSEDYDRSQRLAEMVFEALEGDFRAPEMAIYLEDSTEEYEDGKFVQVLLFSIE